MNKLSKKEIFGIVFFIVFAISWSLYFGDYYFSIGLIFKTILLSIAFYAFYLLWVAVRKKKDFLSYPNFYCYLLYRLSILTIVLAGILGGFSYYYLKANPYKIPTYTLTNGDKEIVFNGMVHIGSDVYYSKVANEIKNQIDNGYIYLFEGVKRGTEESETKFNNALGFKLDKETYPALSKIYGLETQQDNNDLMALLEEGINVDISIDKIVSEYEKVEIKKENSVPEEAQDISNEVIKIVGNTNPKVLKEIIVPINKAMLSFIIRNENIQTLVTEELGNAKLFDIILDKRNEHLVDYIVNSKDKKLTITYGDLHFDGVLKLLRQNDKNWKIKTITYKYPFND